MPEPETKRVKQLQFFPAKLLTAVLLAGALCSLLPAPLAGQEPANSYTFSANLLTQELDCPVISRLPVKLDLSRPFSFEQKIYFENDTHDKVYELDLVTNELAEVSRLENVLFKYDQYLYGRVKTLQEPAAAEDQLLEPAQQPATEAPFAFYDPEKKALATAFLITDYPLLDMLKTCRYYQHDEFLGAFWDAYNHFQLLKVKKDAGYFVNLGFFSSPSFADIVDFSHDKHHLLLCTHQGVLLLNLSRKNLLGPYGFMGIGAAPQSRGGFLTNLLLYGHSSQNRERIIVFSLSGKRIGEYRMRIADAPGNTRTGKPAAVSLVFSADLKKAVAADNKANYYLLDTSLFQEKLTALKLLFPATETTILQPGTPLLANPELNAALVAVLELNSRVTISECSGTKVAIGSYFDYWYRIKTSSGQTGWVYGPYLDQKAIPLDDLLLYKLEPESEAASTHTTSTTGTTDTTSATITSEARTLANEQAAIALIDRLRIRETPALTGKKLGLLAKDEQVKVLRESLQKARLGEAEENWYYIVSKTGLKGWVYGAYLRFDTGGETK